jgi:predicted TIM-barrel fold metal-dependent hydrolase
MYTSTHDTLLNPRQAWQGAVIDCDVHATVPSLDVLFKYQDQLWVGAAVERGWQGPNTEIAYPSGAPTTARSQWRSPGKMPASDVAMLQEHILEPNRVEIAIVNCYYAVEGLRHPDWAVALASSVNDWLIENWLDKDPRLRASIVIPARDPPAAAREIDRVGGHPGFVQVLLPVRCERLYGQRSFWPMFEAIQRHDLVAGLHWGGQADGAPSPTGWASWFAEEMAAETQVFASQMTSLIVEGTFQKFPRVRVAMLEGGFAWLPTWSWNLNKKWKGLRREIPWVDRLPTQIIRDHFRFSIAPMDMGPPQHMKKIIEWIGGGDLLMYASDYPHLHVGALDAFLAVVPEDKRANVMSQTARHWYRL